MRVSRGLEDLPRSTDPSFVVVGVFDGLHLGHAYLLEHLVAEARGRGARPVVITFDHHPDEILTGSAPPLLCDPEERLERLAAGGVEATVVVHFDQRLRETTYDAFVSLIAERGPISGFLMTPDAAFGYQRAGTPAALSELGRSRGFDVSIVQPFALEGHAVSSTDVRTAISSGDLALASRLLGRHHAVVGSADEAGQMTRLRFPLPVALPPDGEYDARIGRDTDPHDSVATVWRGEVRLSGLLTGAQVRVAFLARRGPASI